MTKRNLVYVCTNCEAESPKDAGRCKACRAWNTLRPQADIDRGSRTLSWTGAAEEVRDLSSITPDDTPRRSTGLAEFDRVLGGGLVAGSISLIGGDPGVGKSTLLLQTAGAISSDRPVLYVTGEESLSQISLRARRLRVTQSGIRALAETDLRQILDKLAREKPGLAIVDSIQTLYHPEIGSTPGTVTQVRECAALLTQFGKRSGCPVLLVGHVTKEGDIAGPQVLEHMVDTVLYFEGTHGSPVRLLRALKNRFGAVNELGIFSMEAQGLEEVANPSNLFLTQAERPVEGCAVFPALEGHRPLLVEVQALVEGASPSAPNPRRYCAGLDVNRLQMMLAVLHKHAELRATDKNVYVKVVGGVRLNEPASDLPVLLALQSSLTGEPLPEGLVAFGEVGLAGEIRAVEDPTTRLKEAAKLGFRVAMIPRSARPVPVVPGLRVLQVNRIESALGELPALKAAA